MENIGKKYGNRKIIALADRDERGCKRYICRCSCGKEDLVIFYALTKGRADRCFRCARQSKRKPIEKGAKFGSWTVTGEPKNKRVRGVKRLFYPCVCSCGETAEILRGALRGIRTFRCSACKTKNPNSYWGIEIKEANRIDYIEDMCETKKYETDY